MEKNNFYTLKGYALKENESITGAMEDYMEMIYRICAEYGYARINILSQRLNVSPSSASKMVKQLNISGLVDFERYGVIKLSKEGAKLGEYLIYRHDVLHRFFCRVNHSDDELEQTEKAEHFINKNTVKNIAELMKKM